MEEKEPYYRYYSLNTEEETLLYYAIYQEDPDKPFHHEIPEVREFFTKEKGRFDYTDIVFLDGKARFTRVVHSIVTGEPIIHYEMDLSPEEFLERVSTALDNPEEFEKRRQAALATLQNKADGKTPKRKIEEPVINREDRNKIAQKRLNQYLRVTQ